VVRRIDTESARGLVAGHRTDLWCAAPIELRVSRPDILTLTFRAGLGNFAPGDSLTFKAAGPEYSRSHLPLTVTDAEIVAVDGTGEPALIRRRVGAGCIDLGAYPLEYLGAARRDAHEDDNAFRLYEALSRAKRTCPPDNGPSLLSALARLYETFRLSIAIVAHLVLVVNTTPSQVAEIILHLDQDHGALHSALRATKRTLADRDRSSVSRAEASSCRRRLNNQTLLL